MGERVYADLELRVLALTFEDPTRPATDAELEALALIRDGWYQVSRAYRHLARLPRGLTGVEALARASRRKEWAELLGERLAGDHYLRCYARPPDVITVDPEVFEAFRRFGGSTYG